MRGSVAKQLRRASRMMASVPSVIVKGRYPRGSARRIYQALKRLHTEKRK